MKDGRTILQPRRPRRSLLLRNTRARLAAMNVRSSPAQAGARDARPAGQRHRSSSTVSSSVWWPCLQEDRRRWLHSGRSVRRCCCPGIVLLVTGAGAASLLIFGPVRRPSASARRRRDSNRRGRCGRPRLRTRRRRGRRAGAIVQPHGGRPADARCRAVSLRPGAASAARRCVARADDAADRDARLSRDAGDDGASARSPHARTLSRSRRAGDATHGAHRRRSARSCASRGRRLSVAARVRRYWRTVRARGGTASIAN